MKTTHSTTATGDVESPELELCISCLKTNAPGTHFCGHCGTPLTSYAATAPFESIFAEVDMWRKAASQSRHSVLVKTVIIVLLLSVLLGWLLPR